MAKHKELKRKHTAYDATNIACEYLPESSEDECHNAIQDSLWEPLQQEIDKCTDDEMLNKVLSKYGLRYEKGDDN